MSLDKKLVAVLCGGTGGYPLLFGSKDYHDLVEIVAIPTISDSGGSSGIITSEYEIISVGDIRNCLVALSDADMNLKEDFQYRLVENSFPHPIGNLHLSHRIRELGVSNAIKEISDQLKIKGQVIPVSLNHAHLIAHLSDGSILHGETNIDTKIDKVIESISLDREIYANPEAIEILQKADYIVFSSGDLFTSIIPTLLPIGIKEAISGNYLARKILISNLITKPGETDNYNLSNFINQIEFYSDSKITDVILNYNFPSNEILRAYEVEGKKFVKLDKDVFAKILCADLLDIYALNDLKLLRHDYKKTSKTLMGLIAKYEMFKSPDYANALMDIYRGQI